MEGMTMSPPPVTSPSAPSLTSPSMTPSMTSPMTFYWGSHAEILFKGFPGPHSHTKFYISLLLLFLLAFSLEWLSRAKFLSRPGGTSSDVITGTRSDVIITGMVLTLLHTLRVGLAYLVMLALMSFNGAVFVCVLAGHAFGFLVFGTRVFGSRSRKCSDDPNLPPYERATHLNLPPLSC